MNTADEPTSRRSPAPSREEGTGTQVSGRVATAVDAPPPPPSATRAASAGARPPARAERPALATRITRARASSPRRTRVVVRKVGPLSVLKFSLLFYLCLMLIVLFALTIVYGVLSAAGAVDSFERVLGNLRTGPTSTGGAVPFEIDGRVVFAWGLVVGLVSVVIWSLISVFVALLYNLITDIIGGVEITLTDKPRT